MRVYIEEPVPMNERSVVAAATKAKDKWRVATHKHAEKTDGQQHVFVWMHGMARRQQAANTYVRTSTTQATKQPRATHNAACCMHFYCFY